MTRRPPSPGQLEQSFARVNQLQAELQRKDRAIGRNVQVLANAVIAWARRSSSILVDMLRR